MREVETLYRVANAPNFTGTFRGVFKLDGRVFATTGQAMYWIEREMEAQPTPDSADYIRGVMNEVPAETAQVRAADLTSLHRAIDDMEPCEQCSGDGFVPCEHCENGSNGCERCNCRGSVNACAVRPFRLLPFGVTVDMRQVAMVRAAAADDDVLTIGVIMNGTALRIDADTWHAVVMGMIDDDVDAKITEMML